MRRFDGSVCVFVAADCPLPEARPSRECPLHVDLEGNTVHEGRADDNFSLLLFDDVSVYCEKKYGVYLELPAYTNGRAKQILDYIRSVLRQTESAELWNVWLLGCWEYDDRPYIHRKTVPIDDLTVADIKGIIDAKNWNGKDPQRPSFYCMEIVR